MTQRHIEFFAHDVNNNRNLCKSKQGNRKDQLLHYTRDNLEIHHFLNLAQVG